MNRMALLILILFSIPGHPGEVYDVRDIRDVTILGAERDDKIGFHMANAGDINLDGFDEVFLKRVFSRVDPSKPSGYLILGGTSLPDEIDLLAPPSGVVTIDGNEEMLRATGIRDFNGDGADDLVICDYAANAGGTVDAGEVLILFGTRHLPLQLDFTAPSVSGVRIRGVRPVGILGFEVSPAGDVNGDGFMDVLLGARGSTFENRITEAFIIYGGTDVPAELSTADLGPHGVRMESAEWEDGLGEEVAGVGDVNGDGFDDVLVSASNRFEDAPDKTYLIYGGTDLPADFSVADLEERGVVFGPVTGEWFGRVLGAAGDVNGDGLADFLIASQLADPQGVTNAGEVYLIFGATDFPRQIFRNQFLQYGMVIHGVEEEDRFAQLVSGPGRLNADRFDDPMLYSERLDNEVQVLVGSTLLGKGRQVPYTELERIEIATAMGTVTYLGDVNGGGWQDFIAGVPSASPFGRILAGRCYLVYGERFAAAPTPTPIEVGDFSGWVLLGTGEVVRTTPLTPTPTE